VLAVLLPVVIISDGNCSDMYVLEHILRFAKMLPQVCFSKASVLGS